MGRGGLKSEIWRCVSILFACGLVGAVLGHFWLCLFTGSLFYVGWLFFSIYRFEIWVHNLSDHKQNSGDLQGLWQDISYDLHRIVSRHDKEKKRLQGVVNRVKEMTSALTDAVVLIDVRGNMEWWNKAAQRLFNFRDMDQGHKLTNLIRHPKFIHYFDQQEYRTPLELTMWRKDRHLEFQVHPFGAGERLVIVRDITRLFKLEQMRKDFVANVSHELRTPLTVIRGYIETLADSPNVPSKWGSAFGQMEQQAERMTALINDLIALTKLETDQKEEQEETIHIEELISSLIRDARAIVSEQKHVFEISGDPALGIVGNHNELRSAVSNLIVNAINYSSENSTITVEYGFNPDGAEISIIDRGIGIDPKHIPRLTERFYRVDASRSVAAGGTGLGLAIVKHVLLRHNAELRIQSKLGQGSIFTCQFSSGVVTRLTDDHGHKNTA